MWTWNCTCINNWPSYRFSPLAKQINCMKILPFIATMLMTSNIEQTTNSFFDYCPPPPNLTAHTHALTVATTSETFTLTCFTREACKCCDGEAICVNPDQTVLSGAGWGGSTLIDQTYQFKYLVKERTHKKKTSTQYKYFSINSNTPMLKSCKSQFWKREESARYSWRQCPLQNDVSHYVRRCNLKPFTNTCQHTFETVQLLQDLFSAEAESWKKLKTSMCFRRLLRVRIEKDQL